jgi:hypothetical protein
MAATKVSQICGKHRHCPKCDRNRGAILSFLVAVGLDPPRRTRAVAPGFLNITPFALLARAFSLRPPMRLVACI